MTAKLEVGSQVDLKVAGRVMTDAEFEIRLAGLSENTTAPCHRWAKDLILRGLLSTGRDHRELKDGAHLVGGTWHELEGRREGRIFRVWADSRAELLWRGRIPDYSAAYRKTRDELAGEVRYCLHGKAASQPRSPATRERLGCRPPPGASLDLAAGTPAGLSRLQAEPPPAARENRSERFRSGLEVYDTWVADVLTCPGGCLRGVNNPNPMLRPSGRFRMPSEVLFVLQQPNEEDDIVNGCLTIGTEDYRKGRPDPTSRALQHLCGVLEIDYDKIYIVNSLFCWQFTKRPPWTGAWLKCMDRGWLRRLVVLCAPRLIVTFGIEALRSILHVHGESCGSLRMSAEMNRPRLLHNRVHLWPLPHPGPTAKRRKEFSSTAQEDGWQRLRNYMEYHNIVIAGA